jgi:hypothetical protein
MKYIHHFLLMIALSMGFLCAKDIRVRSSEALRKKLTQAPYSIVLFYDDSRELKKDKNARDAIVNMEAMFKSLSKEDYYKDAQLQFIRAQVNREGLHPVLRRYELKKLPAFVIFLGREKQSVAYGNLYRDDVEKFIAMNLENKMKDVIKQADELRKKRLEEAKIRAYNRPYTYGPYGYGPWLYPYGWYGYGRPYWYGGYYW